MIDKIIEILDNDGLVIIPTDTIYGIIGNPFSKEAVEKVYNIKNRDKSKKLSIFLNNKNSIRTICKINDFIDKFIEKELKNNTIILEKKDKKYLNLISNDTIGVRIPKDDFLIELLNQYNKPLFATSVNLSNESPLLEYNDIIEKFSNKVELIIESKIKSTNKASKIFKIEDDKIIQLR